ncbi:hypothetical protein UFOVP353_2 [uncultured Caudovirales phage]|uniref:Uncharacterized protein n=1 Tax=uncultured Caudovirales phage TaxID=2100421 RepID=A0A6J5M0R6_9CAUD|nr:hypothetical protein UFOVP353_2 [uncultured Caudovirales phage]
MAALTTQSANDVLNYILRNVAPSWGGASTLYMSLHTGTIGAGGNQTTNEVSYTGYARVAVTRNSSGTFTAASGGASDNGAAITFGNPTAGTFPITATHIALGENASGTGTVIEYTALTDSLVINLNVQPNLAIGTADFTII